jgi:hypothetical protein
MTLDDFIARLGTNHNLVFEETLAIITSYYDFTPTGFTNGIGDDSLCNGPDENQGSCKVFAFGMLNGLDEKQLLACFGEHTARFWPAPAGRIMPISAPSYDMAGVESASKANR